MSGAGKAGTPQRGGRPLRRSDEDEGELARAAAGGDQDAFGRLIVRHALAARRISRAILRDNDEADDAVQDAALAAWRAIDRYDPNRPFRPWLMRIVVNAALDVRRRRVVRRTEPLGEALESAGSAPDQRTEQALLREHLAQGLAALPERQRIALVLFDGEGYSHAEIAAVLKVPEGTVRSYVFHARRTMRRALSAVVEGLR